MLKPTHRQIRRKSRRLFPRDVKIPVGRRVKNDFNFSTVKTLRRGDLVATRNHIYYIVFHSSKSMYTPYTRFCSMINYPDGPLRRRPRVSAEQIPLDTPLRGGTRADFAWIHSAAICTQGETLVFANSSSWLRPDRADTHSKPGG